MFSGLNRERVEYLFSSGAGPGLVKQFLDENRSRLISLGAQFFRRSKGSQQDLQFLLSLPPKAEAVTKSWFLAKIEKKELLAPEALIAQFQAVEDGATAMPAAQRKTFAAHGLTYLLQSPAPEKWLDFLKRPIGQSEVVTESESQDKKSGLSANQIAQALIGANDDSDAAELARFIEALVAVKNGHHIKAEKALLEISDDSMRAALTAAITAAPPEMHVTESRAVDPIELESIEDVDVEKIQVLARPSGRTHPGQPAFLTALALYMDGRVYTTTAEQMKELLGGQNAIIAFPNTKSVRLPADQEIAAWYVEKYSTPHAIKWRVVKSGNAVYTLMDLPFASSNHDAVRLALQQTSIDAWVRPIFRLTDEVVVRLPDDVTDPKRFTFHEPLELWHRLKIWNIDGRRIVLAPLPPFDEMYDCADITALIKRLIEQSTAARQLPTLSHAQVQSFVQALRSDPVDLTEARLRRVEHNFATFVDSREQLLSIVPNLLATPEVKSLIEVEKKRWRSDFESESGKLRAERERLQSDISELLDKNANLSEENRKASRDTKLVVRRAFERAKEAGIASLGDVAVFSALLHSQAKSQVEYSARPLKTRSFPSHGSISQRLCEIGIPIIDATGMEKFVTACAKYGFLILFSGPLSAQMAISAAKGLSTKTFAVMDIPIGLTDSINIDEAREAIGEAEVILLRNCNLSAYEVYGASISDLAVTRLCNPPTGNDLAKPIYVLSTVDGVAALPISDELRAVSVTLDSRCPRVEAIDIARLIDGSAFPGNRLKSLVLAKVVDELSSVETSTRNAALSYAQYQLLE